MSVIKAPFNFVPLPQYKNAPFIPDWGDSVSQDFPFQDGISGKIKLNITAKNDIFVRDGSGDSSFHNIDGNNFIPGSSIKGALRSELEIATFGKMTKYNDSHFAYRDLRDNGYRSLIKDIFAGWLYIHNDEYYLYRCSDDPIDVQNDRISVERIDSEIGGHRFYDFIHEKGRVSFKDDQNRNAKKKYEMLYGENRQDFNRRTNFFYKLKKGNNKGKYLVMTGQPGRRNDVKKIGKHKEFVFPTIPHIDESGHVIFDDPECWKKLNDKVVETFRSIHKNSDDFVNFWEKVLKRGGAIPVFYKYLEDEEFYCIGLTYMLKYPAKKSISDAIPIRFRENKRDMAELIFGYTDKDDALKGRVHFGHGFANKVVLSEVDKRYALSSPKPSYYPLYVNGGMSWNSNGPVSILGRKRYPTINQTYSQNVDGISRDMITTIRPLRAGSMFSAEITFHNLKPVELGALLYVLTQLKYHQLGGLKPYGYGKVEITTSLTIKDADGEANCGEYVRVFTDLFDKEFGAGWQQSATIQELKAMATGVKPGNEHKFKYMQMSMNSAANEFILAKKNSEHLDPFSKLNK